MKFKVMSAAVGAALLFCSAAQAQVIVTNGSFGSGLSGWTVTPPVPGNASNNVTVQSGVANMFGTTTLAQSITLAANQSYLLSFDLGRSSQFGPLTFSFTAAVGGNQLFANTGSYAFPDAGQNSTPYSIRFNNVTAGSYMLSFGSSTSAISNTFLLDNVNVRSVPAPLPLLGLAACFGWSRKMRRRIKESEATA